jgi:hypothetical protein
MAPGIDHDHRQRLGRAGAGTGQRRFDHGLGRSKVQRGHHAVSSARPSARARASIRSTPVPLAVPNTQ